MRALKAFRVVIPSRGAHATPLCKNIVKSEDVLIWILYFAIAPCFNLGCVKIFELSESSHLGAIIQHRPVSERRWTERHCHMLRRHTADVYSSLAPLAIVLMGWSSWETI